MKMKNFIALFVAIVMAAGCVQYNPVDPENPVVEEDPTEFDFSTVEQVKISIDYKQDALIPFQIYAEYPLILTGGNSFKMRTDIYPVAAGFTNASGKYTGSAEIPAYVDSVYIFSSAFFAPTLLTAKVVNKTINAVAPTYDPVESVATKASSTTNSLRNKPAISDWKLWLGSIGKNNGHPRYLLTGDTSLNISSAEVSALYSALSGSIMVNASCPVALRTAADMYLLDTAELSITMLGGNTCWNNSLGYYYYEVDNVPATMSDVKVIALFPNTQDGKWTLGKWVNAGVNRGDAVQLMYYPNISTNSTSGATKIFPKGLKIGFVLMTNGWNSNGSGVAFKSDECPVGTKYYATSTPGLSSHSGHIPDGDAHTAIFKYSDKYNIICFEDFRDDDNFSDVTFVVKSNPISAIGGVPPVPPVNPEVSATTTGIYAFEDNWPYKGDYDMNDVLATYNRTYYYNTSNAVTREYVTIEPFTNYARYTNCISYVNAVPADAVAVTDSVKGVGAVDFTPVTFSRAEDSNLNGTIYRITNDVTADKWKVFKLSFVYNNPRASLPVAHVFVNRGDKEIHIPFEAPTSEINYSYFGTGDDKTDLATGNYFSSTGNYPFAIYLSNANERDLFKLLDAQNEQTPIDSLYPQYIGWVTSGGQQNTKWYKE